MTKTVHPSLYNVRSYNDFNEIEEDVFERYNVPENWLMLELLGLTQVYEIINKPDDTLSQPPPLPKRPSIIENVANRYVPLFLRM